MIDAGTAIRRSYSRPPRQRIEEPVSDKALPIVDAPLHGSVSNNNLVVAPPAIPFGFLFRWVREQAIKPRRLVRLVVWMSGLLPRAYLLCRALCGGRVDDATYAARMDACGHCPHRYVRVRRQRGRIVMRHYCEACGCPKWILSRLRVKNRLKHWHCPHRFHPGPYPDDEIRKVIVTAKMVSEQTTRVTGGCPGCRG